MSHAPLSEDPNDYCFIDSETRALASAKGVDGDLPEVGVDVYSRNAYPNIWTYCVGDDPVAIMSLDNGFDERLTWDCDANDKLKEFHERALAGTAWYVAWNMGFDRAIWNCNESDFPHMRTDMALDAMVQAGASGLPGKLDFAGKALGLGEKVSAGKALINLFAKADGGTPQSHPDEWQQYRGYAIQDTALLRDVFLATRMLPREEWEDYWVSERINQRGLAVDTEFARRAFAIANANIARINAALVRATDGQITAVTQAVRIRDWCYDRLENSEVRDIMVKEWDLDGEDVRKPAKLSLEKSRLEALVVYFENLGGDISYVDQVTKEVLEHRLYGGSSSPAKFGKMVRMQHGDVLRGQYTFNGAPQTGRYSSRGVQIHNLIRKSLGDKELEFIETINSLELA